MSAACRSYQRWLLSAVGWLIAMAGVVAAYGFTVDDAWITSRYAFNLATGLGHRFFAGARVSDGVTPLWWPYLLALLTPARALPGQGWDGSCFSCVPELFPWHVARWLGLLAWGAGAAKLSWYLSALVQSRPWPTVLAYLAAFATPSVAAWSSSGMETAAALGLVTVSAVRTMERPHCLLSLMPAAIAATLRPELLVFVALLAATVGLLRHRRVYSVSANPHPLTPSITVVSSRASAFAQSSPLPPGLSFRQVGVLIAPVVLAVLPWFAVLTVRVYCFGSPAPLGWFAKTSDLRHGIVYVLAALLVTGPPVTVMAPWAWWTARHRVPLQVRGLTAALVGHAFVCVLVGGDWMPMSRLFVPVLPSFALVFAHLTCSQWPALNTPRSRTLAAVSCLCRVALCVAGQVFVWVSVGLPGARVASDRLALVHQLKTLLQPTDLVAALDVGWVSVAHNGPILDLAGVTDPSMAMLPGGHTSKAIPEQYLDSRGVTHLLVLLDPSAYAFEPALFKPGPVQRYHVNPASSQAADAWKSCNVARAVEYHLCRREHGRFTLRAELRSTSKLSYLLLSRTSP